MTTRKQKVSHSMNKSMTIPQLRKAFEHIDRVAKKSNDPTLLQKEWKKLFSKEISLQSAKDYLQVVKSNQKGGSASIDGSDDMRLPLTSLEGIYPNYLRNGFDVSVPVPAVGVPASQAQKGGKRSLRNSKTKRAKKVGGGVFQTSPPSMLNDIMNLAKGSPYFMSSPRPEIHSFSTSPLAAVPYTASISNRSSGF